MSAEDSSPARTHLGRAGRQGKNAARNVATAAELAAEPALNGAEHLAEEAVDTAKRVDVRGLSSITGDAGTGFLALSVALYAGVIAYNKFGAVIKGRGRAVR